MSFAKVSWNGEESRFELNIDGKLKAYSQGDHEKGRDELQKIAEQKGYTVHVENKSE